LYRDARGKTAAIQKIALLDGKKAPIENPKRFLGGITGTAAYLGDPASAYIVVTEGFETGLAIFQSLISQGHGWTIAIAGSAYNLANIPLRRENVEIYIAGDRDANGLGQKKAIEAAEAIRNTRRYVHIAIPPIPRADTQDTGVGDNLEERAQALIETIVREGRNPSNRLLRFQNHVELHEIVRKLFGDARIKINALIRSNFKLRDREIAAIIDDKVAKAALSVNVDWLDTLRDTSKADVARMIINAEQYRPQMYVNTHTAEVTRELITNLATCPKTYQKADLLVEVALKNDRDLVIKPLHRSVLSERTTDLVQWMVLRKGESVPCLPPKDVIDALYYRGSYPDGIRNIRGIINAPVMLSDGRVLDVKGYDEISGLFYYPFDDSYENLRVAEFPSYQQAREAANRLLELVSDFPFASPGDKSAWLSLVITLAMQYRITGKKPLFLVVANLKGAGKGLALDVALWIVLGKTIARDRVTGKNEDEMGKYILARLIDGDRVMFWDNLSNKFGGAAIDSFLTAPEFGDRLLGVSRYVSAPCEDIVVVATGNNLELIGDLDRRVVRISLRTDDADHSRRTDFKIPDLERHLCREGHRGSYLADVFTIIRAWDLHGQRKIIKTDGMGSFQGWNVTARQIPLWLGLSDPCEPTRSSFSLSSDDTVLIELLLKIYELKSETPWTGKDILKEDGLSELLRTACYGKDPDTRRLASFLRKHHDTPYRLADGRSIYLRHIARSNGHESGKYLVEIRGEGKSQKPCPGLMPDQTSEGFIKDSALSGHGGIEDYQTLENSSAENRGVCEGKRSSQVGKEQDSMPRCPKTLDRTWLKNCNIRLVTDVDELQRLIRDVDGPLAWDVETEGLTSDPTKIVGHAFGLSPYDAIYVPVNHESYGKNVNPRLVMGLVGDLLTRSSGTLLVYNHQYEGRLLRNAGFDSSTTRHDQTFRIIDVKIQTQWARNDGGSYGLKESAKSILRLDAQTLTDTLKIWGEPSLRLRGRRRGQLVSFGLTDPEKSYDYPCSDVLLTRRLYDATKDVVKPEIFLLEHQISDLFPLDKVLFDHQWLKEQQQILSAREADLRNRIQTLTGDLSLNPSSSQQMGRALTKLGATLPTTRTGKMSTDDKTLKSVMVDSRLIEVVKAILAYREIRKMISTWITPMLQQKSGVFQFRSDAETGRFTSGNKRKHPDFIAMNGQSLKKGGKQSAGGEVSSINIRRGIIARPGCKLVSMDFSQIELRIAKYFSGEPNWDFSEGGDPHRKTMEAFGLKDRGPAKVANFNLIYGGGPGTLIRLGISIEKAEEYCRIWRETHKEYLKWYWGVYKDVRHRLHNPRVETAYGRVRILRNLADAIRNATTDEETGRAESALRRAVANSIIQGTAADINKMGLVNVRKYLRENRPEGRVLMTIHDEIVLEIRDDGCVSDVCSRLARLYSCKEGEWTTDLGEIPIAVEVKVGENFAELQKLELPTLLKVR
jgi:DNA polymerase I-like protein with 3'-5' exonuclease and polymerase domains